MNRAQLREAVRRDLSDIDETEWGNKDINRAIQRAVWDLSRRIPLEKIHSAKVDYTVTDETFNSGARDVAVSLSGTPVIQPKSEAVTSKPAGTDYTRDTDYTMDYDAGTITVLSTGSMAASTDFLISFNKSKVALDISSLTDLIRVLAVEYPAGNYPEDMVSFSLWGDLLYVIASGESQKALTEDEYAVIFYQASHTIPTESADGSYPEFLDEVVAKGAGAYALLTKAFRLQHSGRTSAVASAAALTSAAAVHASVDTVLGEVDNQVSSANTALGEVASHISKAATALTKVQTHGAGADAAYDAVAALVASAQSALGNVDGEITAMGTALTAQDTVWASLLEYIAGGTGIKGAQPFLKLGLDNYLNKVNIGVDAPELARRYAESEVSIAGLWQAKAERYIATAQARVQSAADYINQGGQYVAAAQSRIGEGTGRVTIANAFVAEASQRLQSAAACISKSSGYMEVAGMLMQKAIRLGERVEAYLAEADRQGALVTRYTELATLTKIEAVERRAEFWAVLDDRKQYLRNISEVSRRQYK